MTTTRPIDRAKQTLRERFGYQEFRPGQEEVIAAILNGQDVVAVMPTGGGKSLCYQIPALLLPNTTVVVSPLIALMRDQVDRLQRAGIRAAAIHSGMEYGAINNVIAGVARGETRILYVAPERLESSTFRRMLRSIPLSMLAVDEAHCISEWGHDFRPSYQSIASMFDDMPRVPIMAVTATATPDVRRDIVRSLQLRAPVEIVRGFDRPNLSFRVVDTPHKVEFITREVRKNAADTVIVYCGSRRRVMTFAEALQQRGMHALAYHAGLDDATRSHVQDQFLDGNARVLVATNAFGMGVDKADVRHVIHTDYTLTLEAYYQEAGRAGRDGNDATCTLLVQQEDRRLMDFFIESSYPEAATIQAVYDHVFQRLQAGIGQGAGTTLMADAASIGAALTLPAITVHGVLTMLERAGVLLRTTPNGTARVRLRTSAARLQEVATHARPERAAILDAFVRRIGGRGPDDFIDIDIAEFVRRTGATVHEVADTMTALQQTRMIVYTPPASQGALSILANRERVSPVDVQDVHRRRAHAQLKFDVMVRYASTPACKRNYILQHFGDASVSGTCGRCSTCQSTADALPPTQRQQDMMVAILRVAYQLKGAFGKQLIADVVTGTMSDKVATYELHRCEDFGALKETSRREVLDVLDAAIGQGYAIQSSGLYPVVGVSAEGTRLIGKLPRPIEITWQRTSASPALLSALRRTREQWAARDGAQASALVSLQDLERIASDRPETVEALRAGRHGSAAFLERYGKDVVNVVLAHSDVVRAVPATIISPEILRMAEQLSERTTLRDLARTMQRTPAAMAHDLERAIRLGVSIERGSLVGDDLYADVSDYLRHHRRAGMRDVIEHLGGEVDLPVLRVAIALARRQLYHE